MHVAFISSEHDLNYATNLSNLRETSTNFVFNSLLNYEICLRYIEDPFSVYTAGVHRPVIFLHFVYKTKHRFRYCNDELCKPHLVLFLGESVRFRPKAYLWSHYNEDNIMEAFEWRTASTVKGTRFDR